MLEKCSSNFKMDGWEGGYNRGSFVRVNAMIGMTDTRGQLFKMERIRESRGGDPWDIYREDIPLSLSLFRCLPSPRRIAF